MFFITIFFVLISVTGICNQKLKLTEYKENIYSQYGEDGIIQKIFEIIGARSKIAVEFGAADGFWFSNTANLWTKDSEWKAILIEADDQKFEELKKNIAPYSCIPIHKSVGISSYNSLEAILNEIGFQETIDLLSIDIDGNDYYIFNSLQKIRPRLIISEYNPSIPAHLDVYSDYDTYVGCSVAALQRIANQKGYTLIAITNTNCFFVVNEELHLFKDYEIDREHLRIDRYISYIINDYSGQYKIIASSDFMDPWGWNGNPSPYHYHGDITTFSNTIHRDKSI